MRFLIIALSVIGILASSNAAKADRRVAFVVGNGAYRRCTTSPTHRSTPGDGERASQRRLRRG